MTDKGTTNEGTNNEGTNSPPSFERAEFAPAQCVRCGKELAGQSFLMHGQTLCTACAEAGIGTTGGGLERKEQYAAGLDAAGSYTPGLDAALPRAILVGIGAAALGCVLYAGVEVATGWTIGYVALAVGWLVGKGMKWGSQGRGGRSYQIAAAMLTYLAVSFAGALVVLYQVYKQNPGMHLAMTGNMASFLLKFGLLSPFLELRGGVSGIIGLFILFIGVRTAWSLTAGSAYGADILSSQTPGV